MKPFLRELFKTLIFGILLNLICICIALGIMWILCRIAGGAGMPDGCIVVVASIASIIFGLICNFFKSTYYSNDKKLRGYWLKRFENKEKPIKSYIFIPIKLIYFATAILCLVFFILNIDTSAKLHFSSEENSGFLHGFSLCCLNCTAIFQFFYGYFVTYKTSHVTCPKCKSIYCFERGTSTTDITSSTTSPEVKSTPDYYVKDDKSLGRRNSYSVGSVTKETIYEKYICTCLYCGHTFTLSEYKGVRETHT